ncbi:Calcium binding [Candidatus Electrothrix laxa]
MAFNIGDSVAVKKGVKDPDLGNNIGAWQGRISEIDEDLICIDWDSITLQQMPASSIIHSEEEGWEWQKMYLSHSDVTLTKRRDSSEDVARVFDELSHYYMWVDFGEQGKRIQSVLSRISRDDETAVLQAWKAYLQKNLTFPFQATVEEMMLQGSSIRVGDTITVYGIGDSLDENYGLFAELEQKKPESPPQNDDSQSKENWLTRFFSALGLLPAQLAAQGRIGKNSGLEFPLADIEAVERSSKNYQPLKDYVVWHANR